MEELHLDETGKMHLRSVASWAMVIVVTSVIGYLVSIFQALNPPAADEYAAEGFDKVLNYGNSIGGTIFYVMIGLLVNYFLYRFAARSKSSIDGIDSVSLNSGVRSLKIYFAITSILMILAFLLILFTMTIFIR